MSGLSSTLFDTGTIALTGDHSASATSGSTICGRALSDISHTTGLRYFEAELTARRSSGSRWFGVGFTDSTSGLTSWIGAGSDHGAYLGAPSDTTIGVYVGGSQAAGISAGASSLIVGARLCFWLDAATRRVWVSSRPRNGWLIGSAIDARPDLGTAQTWTVPGTGAIRVAITPGFGSGSDRNTVRFRSRYGYGEITNGELLGALPWDARAVTINLVMRESIGGAYIATGTEVSYHVFEAGAGGLLTPTSVGTATVGSSGALALPASISVDPGATVWVAVSTSPGTPGTQARSHFMPVVAP